MKKIYRILVLVAFLLLIGIIIFFVLKVNQKIRTKLYVNNNDYLVVLNTNELDKTRTTINIDNKDYKTDFALIYHQNNLNIYNLSIYELSFKLSNSTDIFVYLKSVSLIKYLTSK